MKTDYQKLADYFLSVGQEYNTGDYPVDEHLHSWIVIYQAGLYTSFWFIDGKYHNVEMGDKEDE